MVPAWEIKDCICPGHDSDDKFAQESFEEAKRFLEDLGPAMVEVVGYGISVGDYMIRPYLINTWQWSLMCKYHIV